jgi:hypothetical protein
MIINKITELFPQAGQTLNQSDIQAHIDEQNSDSFNLVAVDNLVGWYRFFWEKTIE